MSNTDNICPPKSVWGVVQQVPTTSLNEVMSEQLAKDLVEKEERSDVIKSLGEEVPDLDPGPDPFLIDELDGTADDFLIAQMLQLQFDQEYDKALEKEASHVNGTNKLTISYSKYKMMPMPFWDDDSEEGDDESDERKRDLDSYETADKEMGQLPRCGYKKIGGTIVTKHDREISERSNGRRIMEFPPGIETGDGAALKGPQMQVSNAVYNKIRNFSMKEAKRKNRIHDKSEKSTSDQAVDPQTRLILFKLVNNGILESIHGVISTGKEAVILYADGGPGPDDAETPLNIPKEVAVKVFKTTLNEFKNRDKYIRDDYRFRDRFSKQNPRKVIHMWAEKEMHNLLKMSKFGIAVPEVIMLKKHILVMSFLGDDGKPAPKLKDANLPVADMELAYSQVVGIMGKLYNEVHLVHADLSEYNILWHDGQCWFIDVSQSVEPNHPHGLEFLYRDCKNISDFFTGRGVHDCLSPEGLFTSITGLPLEEGSNQAEILTQVQNYEKNEEILSGVDGAESEKVYPFDYCWEKSKTVSPARPIPGHARPKSSSGGKSPRSPKSGFVGAKSPKTPPKSPSLAGLSDDELRTLKEDLMLQKADLELQQNFDPLLLLKSDPSLPRKESQVKFDIQDEDS